MKRFMKRSYYFGYELMVVYSLKRHVKPTSYIPCAFKLRVLGLHKWGNQIKIERSKKQVNTCVSWKRMAGALVKCI